ncbi:ATP-binding protein [Rhodospirillum sp. A1_3_36]|uniref:sensor histidine kinase n=1 Tax=Rhodospirillum sp. A1_3_36 TaxID=3391666 RepID=UPI0039A62A6C
MTRRRSWSMRFALGVSAVFVIGAITSGGVTYALQSRELEQRLRTDVKAMAEGLSRTALGGDRQDLVEQVEVQSRVWRDGTTLVSFIDGATHETIGNLRVKAPFEGPRLLVVGRDILSASANGGDDPDAYYAYGVRTPLGWVLAARDEAWVVDSGEVLLQTTAWGLGGALLLTIALAVVVARKNEGRLTHMEGVLDQIRTGHLGARIRDTARDDLGRIGEQVDATLDRLEASMGAVRQVSTDVAHDLRAPLSRLRMRLESRVLDSDLPEEIRREIGTALSDLDGVTHIFDAILRLARLQSGSIDRKMEAIDLGALASQVHEILQASAEDAGHILLLEVADGVTPARGDRELLIQAVVNLVDNALRHCPVPTRVILSVDRGATGAGPVLSVRDNGLGIPKGDRGRVLERFVRLDRSRSTPGTGLGLSLVAAIVDLHGGRLELLDAEPGLLVQMTLPPPDDDISKAL